MNNYEEIKNQWTLGDVRRYPHLFVWVCEQMENDKDDRKSK